MHTISLYPLNFRIPLAQKQWKRMECAEQNGKIFILHGASGSLALYTPVSMQIRWKKKHPTFLRNIFAHYKSTNGFQIIPFGILDLFHETFRLTLRSACLAVTAYTTFIGPSAGSSTGTHSISLLWRVRYPNEWLGPKTIMSDFRKQGIWLVWSFMARS
jgi:hypothetical protein